jgi:hypothetical protein
LHALATSRDRTGGQEITRTFLGSIAFLDFLFQTQPSF